MLFAAGASGHPVSAHATGEVVGEVIEQLGGAPPEPVDVAFLFATPGHAGAMEDAAGVVRRILAPRVLVGATSTSVFGPEPPAGAGEPALRGSTGVACMALWVGCTGRAGSMGVRVDDELGPQALPSPRAIRQRSTLVLLDAGVGDGPPTRPASCADRPLAGPHWAGRQWAERQWAERHLVVVGGACAAAPDRQSILVLDDKTYSRGAVGVMIASGPTASASTCVLPAWRPVGPRHVVTGSERNMVYELDGDSTLGRLRETASDHMAASELHLVDDSLHLAVATERAGALAPDTDASAWALRRVLGADPVSGALALEGTEEVPAGSTVAFAVRDPAARDKVWRYLTGAAPRRAGTSGALVFEAADALAAPSGRAAPGEKSALMSSLRRPAPAGAFPAVTAVGLGVTSPFARSPGGSPASAMTNSVAVFARSPDAG